MRSRRPSAATSTGQFRTFADGPFSFGFAFGSCATTGSNNAIFDVIRRRKPHLFLHLGDFHYANIPVDDPWRFRDASNRVLRSPRQSALYREAPISTSTTTTTSAPTMRTARR